MIPLLALLCGYGAAHAATITVDTTADDTTANSNCTLREAVIAANTDAPVDACSAGSGADVITVPAGTYVLSLVGSGEDAAATGDLDVTEDVDIQGAGAASTTIDGSNADRVFDVDPAADGISVKLSGLTVRKGGQVGEGTGIRNAGTLNVLDCVVRDNVAAADSALGGGILNAGTLSVTNSSVSNNAVQALSFDPVPESALGGGIFNAGTLSVTNSSISNNTIQALSPDSGSARGGGIYNTGSAVISSSTLSDNLADAGGGPSSGSSSAGGAISSSGQLTIDACLLSGNTANNEFFASASGGAISSDGALTVTNSTISGNSADSMLNPGDPPSFGGGLALFAGTVALRNNTIAGNSGSVSLEEFFAAPAVTVTLQNTILLDACQLTSATVNANAYNLGDSSCGLSGTDIVGVDPLLGPLQDNGGPTFTRALAPTSPAIDAGNPAMPGSGGGACEASDQRGVTRPQGPRCDIGSVEFNPCPVTPRSGCATPGKSLLLIKDRDGDGATAKDKLIWKFLKGPAEMQSDFGDPLTTADYTLCIYAGASPSLALQARAPAGGTCGAAPCWKAVVDKGYQRSDIAAAQNGLAKIILKGGSASKVIIKGKGSALDLDAGTLPLDAGGDVIVQLGNDDNSNCWESSFPSASIGTNTDSGFKAKTP